ncbi:MAG TPA: ribose-5-phosphate isomerase RpiA [Polyangiaceae bacterium]|nr:ribose-5-phosphate isomerase RpiA [Polyangiaceae bacterium]
MDPDAKIHAARASLKYLSPDITLGLGSGSTAHAFVRLLAAEVSYYTSFKCICTSSATETLAKSLGLRVIDANEIDGVDLTIDGADEVDERLNMIKGGGGAMLRERIVAAMSKNHITIVDSTKVSNTLGRFPLPIEVAPYAHTVTTPWILESIRDAGCRVERHILRTTELGQPYVTDNGNHILDVKIAEIRDPSWLSDHLYRVSGMIAHGLFVNLTKLIIVADDKGSVRELR